MSTPNIISILWNAIDHTKLTDEQLQDLSCSDEIRSDIDHIADIMDGIGCLVADDKDAGNFQSVDDVPSLLWGLASTVRASARALLVSNEASYLLLVRARATEQPIGRKP